MTKEEAIDIFYGRKEANLSEKLQAQSVYLKSSGTFGEVAMQRVTHQGLATISEALHIMMKEHTNEVLPLSLAGLQQSVPSDDDSDF